MHVLGVTRVFMSVVFARVDCLLKYIFICLLELFRLSGYNNSDEVLMSICWSYKGLVFTNVQGKAVCPDTIRCT